MTYFAGLHTVEEIKAHYRRLAMIHHPDRGGDTATMQEVNSQYTAALKACNGQTSEDSEGREHTYRYDEAIERAVMEALGRILKIKMTAEVALIGTWIWVIGDTKPVKDALKDAGCSWHSKRVAWYWRPESYRTHYNARADLGGLAAKYGCKIFDAQPADALA